MPPQESLHETDTQCRIDARLRIDVDSIDDIGHNAAGCEQALSVFACQAVTSRCHMRKQPAQEENGQNP